MNPKRLGRLVVAIGVLGSASGCGAAGDGQDRAGASGKAVGGAQGRLPMPGAGGGAGGGAAGGTSGAGGTSNSASGAGGGSSPAGEAGAGPAASDAAGADRTDVAVTPDSSPTEPGPSAPSPGGTVCINADGPDGMETYALLDGVFGASSIENPDADHMPPYKHVKEEIDPDIGPVFAVHVHRNDSDMGRDNGKNRVEIKVNGGASDVLKATEGETITYTWRFKMDAGIVFSPRFNAMMQMKAFGGNAGLPVLNIKVQPNGGPERLLVEYIGDGGGGTKTLGSAPIAGLKGIWLDVLLRTEIKNNGSVFMTIKKPDGTSVINVDEKGLDMWRQGEYQRLKLGLYRGKVASTRELEIIRFANIGITPGPTPSSDCRMK